MVCSRAILAPAVIRKARALTRDASRLTAYSQRYSAGADEAQEEGRVSTSDGVSIEYICEGQFAGARIRLPRGIMKDVLLEIKRRIGARTVAPYLPNPNSPEPDGLDVLVGNSADRVAAAIRFVRDSVAADPQTTQTSPLPVTLAKFAAAVNAPTHATVLGVDVDLDALRPDLDLN